MKVMENLPLHLVFVRHGQSTHNEVMSAFHRSSMQPPDWYFEEHDAFSTLTPKADETCRITGDYLNKEFPTGFDRYIVSDLPRTLQTAGKLALIGVAWEVNGFWRERDYGEHARFGVGVPEPYEHSHRLRALNPLLWSPRGGESQATEVSLRIMEGLRDLRSDPPVRSAVVVTHGEVIETALFHLENLSIVEWNERKQTRKYPIANNQVVHFSREDPATGEEYTQYIWRKSVCVWDDKRNWDGGEWVRLNERKLLSNEEILRLAQLSLPKVIGRE